METMWKGIQFFKATFTVFAIVAVQNVHNQNPTECIAYLNGTYRNSPFAGVLKVKNGTRLNFVYRETESDCNNSHIGWHVGYTHISAHRNKTKALYNFSDSVHQESDGACLHEFNMTVILNFASSGMPQSNIIYFEKSPNSYVTYKICSRNLTANYIMVILENENSEQPTSPAITLSPVTSPKSDFTPELCPDCNRSLMVTAFNDVQSNLSTQISECEKLDNIIISWLYTLLGVQLLSVVIALFAGVIITVICCKLQQKQTLNQVHTDTQFINPMYQGDATDQTGKVQ